jgi:lipooligosaccharide transport system permease protein
MEPLIFLAGIGLGLGGYIPAVGHMSYIKYLAIGLPLSSAMFTAAFECTFGTFIRLEFSKTYDGMLTGPLCIEDLFIGEIIWAGTKGAFYSLAVLFVLLVCHVIPMTT